MFEAFGWNESEKKFMDEVEFTMLASVRNVVRASTYLSNMLVLFSWPMGNFLESKKVIKSTNARTSFVVHA